MMGQLNIFAEDEGLLFPGNLLTYDPAFLEGMESLRLLDLLGTTVPWEQHPVTVFGKTLLTPRLTAWYGDPRSVYRYSGSRFDPLPWTPPLLEMKTRVESHTGAVFNSVLLNYYRDGSDSVAWHSDHEEELGDKPLIASVSLGQERKFEFRKKLDHRLKYALKLGNGSLLIMKGRLQDEWEHRIPKSSAPMIPRIGLTFRMIR